MSAHLDPIAKVKKSAIDALVRPMILLHQGRAGTVVTTCLYTVMFAGALYQLLRYGLSSDAAATIAALTIPTTLRLNYVLKVTKVFYDSASNTLSFQRPRFFGGVKKTEYPGSDYRAVVSTYRWGRFSMNDVHLAGRSNVPSLHVASFPLHYKFRSFWDVMPKIVEAEGAARLREQLRSLLAIEDRGFQGLERSPSGK